MHELHGKLERKQKEKHGSQFAVKEAGLDKGQSPSGITIITFHKI